MKYKFFLFLFFFCIIGFVQCETKNNPEDNIPVNPEKKSRVFVSENGDLILNVSEEDIQEFKNKGFVYYSDFGAAGNGKDDDINAIAGTHMFANKYELSVKADNNASYYIGGNVRTAVIQTDTDFGNASFTIDDTDIKNRSVPVFLVSSVQKPFNPGILGSLQKNQKKIDMILPGPCLISVTDSNVKRYIRYGANQNNGSSQTDIFIVDKEGNIDMDSPVIWDFNQITEINAIPVDEAILTIKGGVFTTIANQDESKYTYYNRGINIKRSNVVVDGIVHHVTGEGSNGSPYSGFISISDCSYVTVKNCTFTGHKTYRTIGSAGVEVSMGTYDININRALNISFINCTQTTDINDDKYWGIMGSNYCKNLLLDNCIFSRFDAHMGVCNATIRNSSLGHQGVNAIGSGTFTIENSTLYGRSIINLRPDYGSTWEGEFIVRDCKFVPANGRAVTSSLISGSNSGQHNFGYTCYMPEKITFENLYIDDSKHLDNYRGPAIFSNFNSEYNSDSYVEEYPFIKTNEVILKNVTTASGKEIRLSDNLFMFKDVQVRIK